VRLAVAELIEAGQRPEGGRRSCDPDVGEPVRRRWPPMAGGGGVEGPGGARCKLIVPPCASWRRC
jgi:hypothetical protein